MRTPITTTTIIRVFGINRDRDAVTVTRAIDLASQHGLSLGQAFWAAAAALLAKYGLMKRAAAPAVCRGWSHDRHRGQLQSASHRWVSVRAASARSS